jgi:opacity protein-like surface antigen
MKRQAIIIVLLLAAIFILSVPEISLAEHKNGEWYATLKGGAYFPTGDLQDNDFETNFNGEIVLGRYLSPNLALEFGSGYFRTEANFPTVENDVWVIPVIANIKGIIPIGPAELFGGGGFGVYFANLDSNLSDPVLGYYTVRDNDAVFGGHFLAGANLDITKNLFLGIEGKYIFTADARLLDSKVNLDGFTATGCLGIRF